MRSVHSELEPEESGPPNSPLISFDSPELCINRNLLHLVTIISADDVTEQGNGSISYYFAGGFDFPVRSIRTFSC